MASFDTLIFGQALGLTDRIIKEVKTQYEYTNHIRGELKESYRVHRLLRSL